MSGKITQARPVPKVLELEGLAFSLQIKKQNKTDARLCGHWLEGNRANT